MIAAESQLKKPLPSSDASEKALLGLLILDPNAIDEVVGHVKERDFFDPAHAILFRHFIEIHEAGKRIDLTLLVTSLTKSKELERVGGIAYLHSLFEAGITPGNERYYANEVREQSILRDLVAAGVAIMRDAYDPSAEARKVLGDAEQSILSIADEKTAAAVKPIKDAIEGAMIRIGDRRDGKVVDGGISTGLADLDKVTGGLHGSELTVIAGRPSMGKTALAMNIAEAIGVKQNRPTLFVSLEMSQYEVGDRMLSSLAKINGHKLRNGTVNDGEFEDLLSAASEFNQSALFLDDSPTRSVSEIAAAARRVKRRAGGLACIVIDYLQLIEPDNHRDPRQEQVAKISRRLKQLAREMNIPVIILAQLNRQTELAKDNRPRLSHLRESGAIEQDADVVLFVHREEYYATGERKEELKGQAEIIIAKQRNGPVEDVKVAWQSDFTRFVTVTPENHEACFEQGSW